MVDMIQTVVSIYRAYSGSSIFMLLVLIALLYLWITEENRDIITVLVYLVTGLFALFFIPVYAYVIIHFILEEEVYYRMLWLVPTAAIFAYAAVRALIRTQGLFRRCVVTVLLICLLAGSGSCVFTDGTYARAENAYHVPQTIVDILEIIESDEVTQTVALPAELVQYARQIDSDVVLAYGREMLVERWNHVSPLFDAINAPELDIWTIQSEARRAYCTCIVIDGNKKRVGDLEDELYTYIATVDHYMIYIDSAIAEEYYGIAP